MKPYKDQRGYWILPVVGVPDRDEAIERLPVVGERRVHPMGNDEAIDQFAVVELRGEDPIGGNPRWADVDADDCPTAYFVFKYTKEATAGDIIVVMHQQTLTVRYFEPQGNGRVCLRSAEPMCPTWELSADDVNIQGVVVYRQTDLHDSGWA